ncbi:MAG: hypothetical protein J6S57_02085 [Alphaproteobacteria bacterium]|nr:hypothetical protein [Alphaproteobacteria bacterium]
MKNENIISYIINFNNKNELFHTSKCNFKIEHSKVDFNNCPIIAEIFAKGLNPKLNINSIISVDVNLHIADSTLARPLGGVMKVCEKCGLRHRER